MATAIVSGSGGLIGSESVRHLVEAGWDVVGIENDMRARFFGPEASTAPVTARLEADYSPRSARLELDIRDADGVESAFREAPGRSSWSSTPPPSRPTTGRRASRRPTSASTPPGRSTCSRRPARTPPTRRSSSARPTRSTATPPTGCRSRSARLATSCPRSHRYHARHRHLDVDRLLDPLAVWSLEDGRRPAGPGVRPLLRDADGLLPRRLPDRAPARRRPAPRLPRLPDALHGHRDPLHGLRLLGQAGPRQHPQRRPRRLLHGVPAGPQERPPSTTSAAGASATARCWRRSRPASGSAAASSSWDAQRRGADRRSPLVDLRPLGVPRRLPGLEAPARNRGDPRARCTTATSSAGPRRLERLAAVPDPRPGARGPGSTSPLPERLDARPRQRDLRARQLLPSQSPRRGASSSRSTSRRLPVAASRDAATRPRRLPQRLLGDRPLRGPASATQSVGVSV